MMNDYVELEPKDNPDAVLKSKIRGLVLDMDGVLWRGNQPIGDLPALFAEISRRGWRIILATNNSTLSAAQYLQKLNSFGVRLQEQQIVNSSQATAHYLARLFPQGGPVYIIGENGIQQALSERGFFPAEQNVLAVVAGMDRSLTYEKLSRAMQLIHKGALFIGTNSDRTFPTPNGLVPGAGAILAALEAATGVQPTVIGKPNEEMYRIALERLEAKPDETLVVGDRLDTDILGAQKLGCITALVLSGVTRREQALQWKPAPHFIADNLEHLLQILR